MISGSRRRAFRLDAGVGAWQPSRAIPPRDVVIILAARAVVATRPSTSSTSRSTSTAGRSRSCETHTNVRPCSLRRRTSAALSSARRDRRDRRTARRARAHAGCAGDRPREHDPARLSTAQLVDPARAEVLRVEPDRAQRLPARRGSTRPTRPSPPPPRSGAGAAGVRVGTRRRPDRRPLVIGSPSRRASPSLGWSRPARIHASVDLPEPLCPTTSTASP